MILAHFHSLGNEPVARDRLKSLVRHGAIDGAVCRSIEADTPLRPVDFAVSKEHNISRTCSSVQNMEAGQLSGSSGTGLLAEEMND